MLSTLDAKQMTAAGAFALSAEGAGGKMQLSTAWIGQVMRSLDETSPAYVAVNQAAQSNKLLTVVGGVNRTTGQLVVLPVNVPSR